MMLENASNLLRREKNIAFAYIFGSFARGEERKESDIDVAVFVKDKNLLKDHKYAIKLALKLEKILNKEVDVQVLNDKPIVFVNQVLKHGKLLFSVDERARINFETFAMDRYLDFQELMQMYDSKRFERYGIR